MKIVYELEEYLAEARGKEALSARLTQPSRYFKEGRGGGNGVLPNIFAATCVVRTSCLGAAGLPVHPGAMPRIHASSTHELSSTRQDRPKSRDVSK